MLSVRPSVILAIEASNPSAHPAARRTTEHAGPGVAIGVLEPDGVRVLALEPIAAASRHDDDLVPAIERARSRAGVSTRDIARVGVSIGPGGFTALRISVVAAIMIAEALGAELVGVPSAHVAARRVRSDGQPFAIALASKGATAYVVGFDAQGRENRPGAVGGDELLADLGAPRLIADDFLPEGWKTRARSQGVRIEPPRFDASACLELAAELSPADPARLRPIYPREPEAVTLWKQRHG